MMKPEPSEVDRWAGSSGALPPGPNRLKNSSKGDPGGKLNSGIPGRPNPGPSAPCPVSARPDDVAVMVTTLESFDCARSAKLPGTGACWLAATPTQKTVRQAATAQCRMARRGNCSMRACERGMECSSTDPLGKFGANGCGNMAARGPLTLWRSVFHREAPNQGGCRIVQQEGKPRERRAVPAFWHKCPAVGGSLKFPN